jgi:hypothetical protein
VTGGSGGGGDGKGSAAGGNGTANLGGGGGGAGAPASSGGSGGSGVVIIAYPSSGPNLSTIGAGLTWTLDNGVTRSGYKVYRFTAGTGTITW